MAVLDADTDDEAARAEAFEDMLLWRISKLKVTNKALYDENTKLLQDVADAEVRYQKEYERYHELSDEIQVLREQVKNVPFMQKTLVEACTERDDYVRIVKRLADLKQSGNNTTALNNLIFAANNVLEEYGHEPADLS